MAMKKLLMMLISPNSLSRRNKEKGEVQREYRGIRGEEEGGTATGIQTRKNKVYGSKKKAELAEIWHMDFSQAA